MNRRKALFTVAKEHGCNKIALGHHMDDILETLLMNITYQGAFSTMPPRLVMKKFDNTRSRVVWFMKPIGRIGSFASLSEASEELSL